jgi:uncharacterized Zn finger protein (UPF0148 family)
MEQWPKKNSETEKHPAEKLRGLITEMSHDMNASVRETYGIRKLVNQDGTIDIGEFMNVPGYGEEKIREDRKKTYECEVEWSGIHESEEIREFYRSNHGAETEEDVVHAFLEEKKNEKHTQMELFTTLLFNKMLKDDFIVVRASKYDDYMNGIDTVMVNKKTGDVVCAFDEVHDHKENSRAEEKKKTKKREAQSGGAMLTYGISVHEGKFERKEIKNLPVFALALSTNQLNDVLKNMNYDMTISEKEGEIFDFFLSSLEKQKKDFFGTHLPKPEYTNLLRFEQSLNMMKKKRDTVKKTI